MKELILTNWNFWRIIRLVLGLLFVISGFINADYLLAAGGGFVLLQALFNVGCCAGGSCGVNNNNRDREIK